MQGNLIGTSKSGTAPLGNGGAGVTIAAENTAVGGDTAAANTIAFNGGAGIFVLEGTGNRVQRNSIFANGELGIDLLPYGPNANDVGDGDTGANGGQNKPEIEAATTAGGTTTIEGQLQSTPNASFVVRFFANPNGYEGKAFVGSTSVTTDGSGIAAFTFTPAEAIAKGQTVTATATSGGGDTSEFSAAATVG